MRNKSWFPHVKTYKMELHPGENLPKSTMREILRATFPEEDFDSLSGTKKSKKCKELTKQLLKARMYSKLC